MRNQFWGIASFIICLSAGLNAQDREAWVSVSGHVYTQGGQPLAHATVEVFPLELAISGPLPIAKSDEQGAYRLLTPSFGKTRICAKLEDAGYPDTRAKLFASDGETFPEVQLAPGSDLKNVDIHLGAPDGIVEGVVVDKLTQQSVRFARITMHWVENPSVMYSSSIAQAGIFQFALPQRRITLSVAAPGYRTWSYIDPDTHGGFIQVFPASRRTVRIELEKLSPTPSDPPAGG